MPAPHQRERVGVVEVGRAGGLGDRQLAGVDEVPVDVVALGRRAHPEHAVLGVQGDAAADREVVADHGRQPDAEVDVRAGRDVRGDDPGQLPPVERTGMLDRHAVTTRST